MLDIMVRKYGTPSIYLGKLSFGQILLHFQNAITSKPFDRFL